MAEPRKIFISYSHRDIEACSQIDSFLEKQEGFDVWYDKGLIPGEVYRKRIAEVIRDAGYFIILLSNSSVRSDWVLDEVEYAKKLRKRILPIWIENVEIPDDLDMILQRYHSLFWHLRTSDSQFERSLLSMFDMGEREPQGPAIVGMGNQFSEDVNMRMKELLAKEKQQKFDECYSAANAVILGSAYLYGGPCAVDRKKARHYFRAAEYFGSLDGAFYLQQMSLTDQVIETWAFPDEEIWRPAVEKISRLADEGSVPAKLYMGNLYWHGRFGCPRDAGRSAAYYEECARAGNARAQFVMSSNYYSGDGVEKDYELAKMYANLALEQKYIYAWRRWASFTGTVWPFPRTMRKPGNITKREPRRGTTTATTRSAICTITAGDAPRTARKPSAVFAWSKKRLPSDRAIACSGRKWRLAGLTSGERAWKRIWPQPQTSTWRDMSTVPRSAVTPISAAAVS